MALDPKVAAARAAVTAIAEAVGYTGEDPDPATDDPRDPRLEDLIAYKRALQEALVAALIRAPEGTDSIEISWRGLRAMLSATSQARVDGMLLHAGVVLDEDRPDQERAAHGWVLAEAARVLLGPLGP